LAWVCGFSKNGESFKDAKLRSKLAADILEQTANDTRSVLHVGHGIMNHLLIKELRRRKWLVKGHTGEKYWSYTVLEYET
jgi:broad specificity phosphatase PhoE